MNALAFLALVAFALSLLHALHRLNHKLAIIMADQAELNSKLDEANAALDAVPARVAAAIAAASTPTDFAPEVAKVQQVIDKANAVAPAPVVP